jgi:16S rRNA (cytosine1402-N4)-methyltransferase
MMMGSDGNAVAGGLARHIPVLIRRAVEWLSVREGGLYLDATFGAGGYARAILQTPGVRVIGIDRDDSAINAGAALAEEAQGRLLLAAGRFSDLETIASSRGVSAVDGIVFDLGVSSMQLDDAARGFSFRLGGPLDMRMGRDGPSAAELIARVGERELAAIITGLGEERHARAIARAIVKARQARPIETTEALAEIVGTIVRPRATRPPGPFRRCAFSSTTSSANWPAASSPPSACSSRVGVLSLSPFIRSRIESSRLFSPSAAERRPSPGTSRKSPRRRRLFAC